MSLFASVSQQAMIAAGGGPVEASVLKVNPYVVWKQNAPAVRKVNPYVVWKQNAPAVRKINAYVIWKEIP